MDRAPGTRAVGRPRLSGQVVEVLLVAVPPLRDWDEDARAVRRRLAGSLRAHLGERGLRLVEQPRERVEELLLQDRVRVCVLARAAPV